MRLRSTLIVAAAALAVLPSCPLAAQERPRGPLAADLQSFFAARTWRNATWGALVVSLTYGDTLFAWRADSRFTPASNAKLFTTAAALHYLGDDYRFLTVLFADGPIANGELFGDLVLYGTGDPTFALDTASLAPFADSVVRAGIRRVRGDLVGDASFLGAELSGPGWSPDNLDQAYAAPPSALGAAENRIWLEVLPGPRVGSPATFRLDPAGDYYHVSSLVLTSGPRTRRRIDVRRGQSRGVVELTGSIPITSGGWGTWLIVQEPAVFAAQLLRQLLEARGVTISGGTRAVTGDAPRRAQLMLQRSQGGRNDAFRGAIAVRRSATLDEIVSMINHRSHNLSAELALRSIGRVAGNAGTFASGARVVQRYLTQTIGIPPAAIQVTDGSGLSLLDEATPRSLVQLLSYERRAGGSQAFYRSLPVVGEGMRTRMTETAAYGRLRAKTGTLSGVSALSGYIATAGGEELAFSIIVNRSPSTARARAVQDSVGAWLADWVRDATPRRAAAAGN
jgi:D-alanyl-D-alanine carboxypeptidase/D-alanyl-D-alanine-endopeptidase (penicillin-binding protein 4)